LLEQECRSADLSGERPRGDLESLETFFDSRLISERIYDHPAILSYWQMLDKYIHWTSGIKSSSHVQMQLANLEPYWVDGKEKKRV
jgi:hypothetical protein